MKKPDKPIVRITLTVKLPSKEERKEYRLHDRVLWHYSRLN